MHSQRVVFAGRRGGSGFVLRAGGAGFTESDITWRGPVLRPAGRFGCRLSSGVLGGLFVLFAVLGA